MQSGFFTDEPTTNIINSPAEKKVTAEMVNGHGVEV
jgi:hypothetical protein